jgi:hypothetical protein
MATEERTPAPWQYLRTVPEAVPDGKRLVHNPVLAVAADQPGGEREFRFGYVPADSDSERYVECGCGWAPNLRHYTPRHKRFPIPAIGSVVLPASGLIGFGEWPDA